MDDENRIDPNHADKRLVLRVLGPLALLAGVIFILVGLVDFFSSMDSFAGPQRFWCFFAGGPLVFAGFVMSGMGYMSVIARYQAAEMAPVGTDTANAVAPRLTPAVRSLSSAVAQGFGDAAQGVYCTRCGARNDRDANFCKACGHAMR